ncbi:tripartite tricarboxylate transporter TctB family protein [Microbacterium sp. KSW4-11]|uniref:Tripartite tricarboxylate transporter TctB family protein n=1 Tax=Microbacterium gawkjiense TaxID=3067309 RepID=A0ABU3G6E3_9MICO|nr:tripartite tricarboxylate transporter TctB family protein [Microbacterium sp. KSW4-11]MDT3315382.1 tripartite tricarboxylate transporter TctB family protein [Microbacterium sp. KSW4-11]
MSFPANPTSASAVVGERLRLVSGPGLAALLKGLTMPLVLVGFATYLVVGIVTMRVPEGAAFPGPQFFPGIIAAGLYAFAAVLAVGAIREIRATPDALTAELEAERAGEEPPRPVRVDLRSFAWVVLSFLAFAFLLEILGWILAAGLLFWCIARAFGATRPVQSLIVGLTLSSLAYIGFDMALGMPLPSGILGGF